MILYAMLLTCMDYIVTIIYSHEGDTFVESRRIERAEGQRVRLDSRGV
jgi:predicted peroxiredoxin